MTLTDVRKAGIIGAGVSGLATAKQLISQGIECTVFERGKTLGGVWADGYANFGVQVQKELYEFPEYPLPKEVANFTAGPVFQKYLEDYAREFDVFPHIRFSSSVTEIAERPRNQPGWVVRSEQNGVAREEEFDLVLVCVGLYSSTPNMPEFPGQDHFEGRVMHISELKDTEVLEGKKVAVVGYGKSATDAAVESAKVASETTVIFREPHWPVPAKLLGILPFKWAMLNRLTSALIPPYYRPSGLTKAVQILASPLLWLWWRIVEGLLMAQCSLWSRFGTRPSLVPKTPVEIDVFGEATMVPRPAFFKLIRKGVIQPQRTEIAKYTPKGVSLKNGEQLDLDVVIMATGWETDYSFLPTQAQANIDFEEDGFYLYRQMVHPDVDNLVFIGSTSTFMNILTFSLQARWLGELVKGNHQLPARAEMHQDIADLKTWKREWMPFSKARGARILLHMHHYHDQLLRDFGASPLRKKGIFAPFKEALAPYQPSDYRLVVSGEWR
ncbi:MAG: flavin-containing monooxygenase [Dehalococcoidia bacterium]